MHGSHVAWTLTPDGHDVYLIAGHDDDRAHQALLVLARDARTGALRQLPGVQGCIQERQTRGEQCAQARTVAADSLAVSPDGHHVYVASDTTVAVFVRDPASGALRQPAGSGGCLAEGDGCAELLGFGVSIAIAPDGDYLYAGAGHMITVFARDALSGRLTEQVRAGACVGESFDSRLTCTPARALNPVWVAISADGRNLYTAGGVTSAVAVFRRDPASGALTQLAGAAGCVEDPSRVKGDNPPPDEGCADARALSAPSRLSSSPDGHTVYVGASLNQNFASNDTVAVFTRRRGPYRAHSGPPGAVRLLSSERRWSGRHRAGGGACSVHDRRRREGPH